MRFNESNRYPNGREVILTTRESEVRDLFRTPYSARRRPVDLLRSGTSVITKSKPVSETPASFYGDGVTYDRSLRALLGINHEASQDESWMAPARNRNLAKAKHDAVNLAQLMAEYRSTGRTVRSVLESVFTLTRAVVTRNPRILLPRRRWDDVTTRRWLEYTYGIKPLANDLVGVWEALNKSTARPLCQSFRTSYRQNSSKVTFYDVSRFFGKVSNPRVSRVVQEDFRGVCHMVVTYDSESLHRYVGQFGLSNPASLAWELVPFSFVVDWFVDFGSFFASLDNHVYMKDVMVGYYTKSRKTDQLVGGGGSAFGQGTYLRRLPLGKTSTVASVNFSPSLTASRVMSAVSLLAQYGRQRGIT